MRRTRYGRHKQTCPRRVGPGIADGRSARQRTDGRNTRADPSNAVSTKQPGPARGADLALPDVGSCDRDGWMAPAPQFREAAIIHATRGERPDMATRNRRAVLTVSEARAEACTLTLRLWLAGLPEEEFAQLRKAAELEASDIGNAQVLEELGWLFHLPAAH